MLRALGEVLCFNLMHAFLNVIVLLFQRREKLSLHPHHLIGSDGSVKSVPKGANTLEGKLPTEKTMLWHLRFGHIGEKGLRTLKIKNLVEGLNDCNLKFDFCEHCVYG